MTDEINTTGPDLDDDDLFEGAQDTFPSRVHLRDRLVVIYPTGVFGQRPGSNGKPYTWYETTTVVLDDGPQLWQPEVRDDDGDLVPNLVPAVLINGPQVLTKFQWSAAGLTSRIAQKLPKADGKPGSILGRINVIKNKDKGKNPPWSIAKPTDEDMAIARQYREQCAAARQDIIDQNTKAADSEAF